MIFNFKSICMHYVCINYCDKSTDFPYITKINRDRSEFIIYDQNILLSCDGMRCMKNKFEYKYKIVILPNFDYL